MEWSQVARGEGLKSERYCDVSRFLFFLLNQGFKRKVRGIMLSDKKKNHFFYHNRTRNVYFYHYDFITTRL